MTVVTTDQQLDRIFKTYMAGLVTREAVKSQIIKFFDKGMDKAEINFNLNFVRNPIKINFLTDYTFDLITGMTDEIAADLKLELKRAILNAESITKIKERVEKVMDVAETRAIKIARTELNRAMNEGHNEGARQTGLKLKKEWHAHIDARTSKICRALDGQQVQLNDKFKYKDMEFLLPPAHPNCRSRVIYIQT